MNFSFDSLIDLTQQCCDADEYVDMGYVCAQTGNCYNSLRPIGNTLWFGIPYFLDTTENIFFYLHLALFLLTAFTFFHLARLLNTRNKNQNLGNLSAQPAIATLLFFILLTPILWPTFFNTLSDTPATLLLLEGILLTLIAHLNKRASCFFAAGIFLGCAALMRTAYVSPLYLAGFVLFLSWFYQDLKKTVSSTPKVLCIFSFILPMTLQYYTTWQHTQQWSFLSEARSRNMMALHLDSASSGYDTGLQQNRLFWSAECEAGSGLRNSFKNADASAVACILYSRLQFYCGSYAAKTYLGEPYRNFIDNDYAEQIGHGSAWSTQGIKTEINVEPSPLGDQTATRLVFDDSKSSAEHYIEAKSLFALPPGKYRYSIWLSTTDQRNPTALQLDLRSVALTDTSYVVNSTQHSTITLSKQPQIFSVDIDSPSRSYILAKLTGNPDSAIIAWGASLEGAKNATGYTRTGSKLEETIGHAESKLARERIFSNALFLLNIFSLLAASYCLFEFWKNTKSSAVIFVAALLFGILLECLIVIPEQRYFQAVLATSWSLFIIILINRINLINAKAGQVG